MESQKVKGIVYAVVIAILGLVFYSPLTGGADTLYREFIPHCATSTGQTAVLGKVITGANDGTTFTLDATCKVPASTVAADADKVRLDNGSEFTITTAATAQAIPSLQGTAQVNPPPVLTQFSSINRLLIQLLPLLLVISFIGSGVMSGMNISGGGNIQTAIKYEVMILIIALVGVNLAPTLFEFIAGAASTTSGGLQRNRPVLRHHRPDLRNPADSDHHRPDEPGQLPDLQPDPAAGLQPGPGRRVLMATTTRRTTVPSVKVTRKRLTSANRRKRKAVTAANAAQRTLTRSRNRSRTCRK